MARVFKVIMNGVEIEAAGEVEVHVQDGPVNRVLTFGDSAREQVFKGDNEVSDDDLPYDDLFGNSSDFYEDDEGGDNFCDSCGDHVDDCSCYDDEDDEDDEDGDEDGDDDEPWGPDDVVSIVESVTVGSDSEAMPF